MAHKGCWAKPCFFFFWAALSWLGLRDQTSCTQPASELRLALRRLMAPNSQSTQAAAKGLSGPSVWGTAAPVFALMCRLPIEIQRLLQHSILLPPEAEGKVSPAVARVLFLGTVCTLTSVAAPGGRGKLTGLAMETPLWLQLWQVLMIATLNPRVSLTNGRLATLSGIKKPILPLSICQLFWLMLWPMPWPSSLCNVLRWSRLRPSLASAGGQQSKVVPEGKPYGSGHLAGLR